MSRPPTIGPILYTVRQADGLAIAGGGSSVTIPFQFPRSVFVTGVQIVPADGAYASLASLSLRIIDETQQDIFFNSRNENDLPMLAAQGRNGIGGPGPMIAIGGPAGFFPLQRPVANGDFWHFVISVSGAGLTVRSLGIRFEEGLLRRAG